MTYSALDARARLFTRAKPRKPSLRGNTDPTDPRLRLRCRLLVGCESRADRPTSIKSFKGLVHVTIKIYYCTKP